ncbi:hypothetical protein [Campylobacter avium]|uniref:hypothetical protein n=1 Tax=Campylobacter avium TaxID=522485 RepID=UPI00255BB9DB|nr:hypothetical protein [Campylobacter avium]
MKNEWVGEIEDRPVNLNDGDKETVILKKDPTALGNDFKNEADFEYTTTSGSSTLTLQKDPNTLPDKLGSTDMVYDISGDMQVSGNSHLIMNLDSRDGGGLFSLTGVLKVESGANVEIKNINNFVINGLQGAYI